LIEISKYEKEFAASCLKMKAEETKNSEKRSEGKGGGNGRSNCTEHQFDWEKECFCVIPKGLPRKATLLNETLPSTLTYLIAVTHHMVNSN